MSKSGIFVAGVLSVAICGSFVNAYQEKQQWLRPCDGIEVTSNCTGDDGIRYTKFVFHKAESEKTKTITHPAQPAVTHVKHHDAVYGTRRVLVGCIRTNISYKNGTCALSRCRDGKYSGSTGRGTCSYHGGVWYGGGPWYEYRNESYVITPAWDETVVDVPAKKAWTETVVVEPAKQEYYEKIAAK
ncbi:hypothetical protein IKX73_02600 [Candidatus Saccharibacteria bacterium]|nr:hypothetical protein [Candidatus Saccharibacteria bacterium]